MYNRIRCCKLIEVFDKSAWVFSDFGNLGLDDHHHDDDGHGHEHRRRRDADAQDTVEKVVENVKGIRYCLQIIISKFFPSRYTSTCT